MEMKEYGLNSLDKTNINLLSSSRVIEVGTINYMYKIKKILLKQSISFVPLQNLIQSINL